MADHNPPFYCLHCEGSTISESGMETHLKTKCERYTAIYGIDYLDAEGFKALKQIQADARDSQLERFILQLDNMVGADDFVTDCGDLSDGWPGYAA